THRPSASAPPRRPRAARPVRRDLERLAMIAGTPLRRGTGRLRDVLYPVLVIGVLLAAWQAASMLGWLRPFRFPPPSQLVQAAYQLVREGYPEGIRLWAHLGITVQRI